MADLHSLTDEQLAERFHDAYERLAPNFGYRTREASAKPWRDVPENNRALMTAVVGEIRALLDPHGEDRVSVPRVHLEQWASSLRTLACHAIGGRNARDAAMESADRISFWAAARRRRGS